jgi:hypothetical protein
LLAIDLYRGIGLERLPAGEAIHHAGESVVEVLLEV